ncbi:MAG: hypothetical protein E7174_02025 [Firmicutes bacterium]|nr:hypothetical protein [Bacillota bacterium]
MDNSSFRFKPNKSEIEKEKKKILLEINKEKAEINSNNKKNIIIIFVIIIFLFITIKICFGTINIYNIFGYPANKARFYEVTVNNNKTSVEYVLIQKIPIIPFLVNFNSKYAGANIIEKNKGFEVYADDSKEYLININSYSCYSGEYQIECKNINQNMKKNNDTKYTNLEIVRVNNPYEKIYNGKYISNITPYIQKKGMYYIGITAKYNLVETKIFFYFINEKN